MPDPICPGCYQPMRLVAVHHAHQPASLWTVCPACLTTRPLNHADTPTPVRRHLRAVP